MCSHTHTLTQLSSIIELWTAGRQSQFTSNFWLISCRRIDKTIFNVLSKLLWFLIAFAGGGWVLIIIWIAFTIARKTTAIILIALLGALTFLYVAGRC